ncbi:YdeI/OmpD-associated family protein [Lentzea alba]|uniref:YdeI/OmpD-associated family protein n=1 Tax=Lentzea alba TaxID=2714351 RepID=UPI0039BF510E
MNTFLATTTDDWRSWLASNAGSEKEVWLLIHHKDSPVSTIRYEQAIEHALCFGWIDSHHRKQDQHSSALRFSPRRSSSGWSAKNRERAARMTAAGLMTPEGQELIDHAKATGRWEIRTPDDLKAALADNPAASRNFDAFAPSSQRLISEWVVQARKPETRQRRIAETVELATMNIKSR